MLQKMAKISNDLNAHVSNNLHLNEDKNIWITPEQE